jgi:mRNA interferase RelE/StbE
MVSLPKTAFRTVSKKILDLESNPRPHRRKKLSGRQEYRLRVGDFRVLYAVSDAARTIEIVAVGNRKDVYRR